MLQLRKGKTIIAKYETAYDCAEDETTLSKFFKVREMEQVQDFLRKNAFSFAICGGKARLGYGLMLESAAD